MDFGKAIEELKNGKKVCRQGWNGKGMYLKLVRDYQVQEVQEELCNFIGMKTADNKFIPWLASQADVLAEDWQIVGFANCEIGK